MYHFSRKFCMYIAAFAICSFQILHSQSPKPSHSNKVVIISLDAFGAESLHDPYLAIPTLHAMMQSGAYAKSMRPINPTVTWPNHTSIISGFDASHHHVLVNGLIINQRTNEQPGVDINAPKAKLVAVPTVYDAAHAAGLTTAEVDWVAIMNAGTVDWSFAEKPNPDGEIEKDLIQQGAVTRDDLVHFNHPTQAWRDRLYTQAAADIIRKHHPDLMMLHLLALDSIEHGTGWGNDAGRNTMAFLDDRVKDVVQAVKDAGEYDNTTFIVVSDHGQMSVHKHVHAAVLLKQAGLDIPSSTHRTTCMPEGGFAMLYQKNATPESIGELKKLFTGREGVRAALTPEEAKKDGWPIPSATDQAPDLLLYAANEYAMSGSPSATLITDAAKEGGAHGYPNTEPLMQAIFIATGAGIQKTGEIPAFPNVDVAATIANLLHVPLPNVQGKPLMQILK